jgi:formyltetrahydrofolate-dependent phosphoribosylglycinamide formyltransferase
MKTNIAIFSSGSGNSSKKLLENINQLNSTINLIITNKSDSLIIELAKKYKISYFYLPKKKNISNIDYDTQLVNILNIFNINIIFLIGYMRIVTPPLINAFKNKIFNIHPSLLPKYKGLMDLDIHETVIKNNDTYTGCTLHVVEEIVDNGKIILQKNLKVSTKDKYELKKAIQNLENDCIYEFIKSIENNNLN